MLALHATPQYNAASPSRPGRPDPALDPDLLLPHCWRLQDCTSCITTKYHCGWCATSSVCVPNPVTWPILAPIWNPNVCPTRDERWELRGNELGCKVSTTTFLSVVVAVFATLGLLLLGWLLKLAWAWGRTRSKGWYNWWNKTSYNARASLKKWWAKPWREKVLVWQRSRSKHQDDRSADEASRLLG